MSAWMCSDSHLKLVALWAAKTPGVAGVDVAVANEATGILWEANRDSLLARYGDSGAEMVGADAAPEFMAADVAPLDAHAVVEVLKQIRCYRYQSCEHKPWSSSQAHMLTERAEDRAIAALPGYADATWGI